MPPDTAPAPFKSYAKIHHFPLILSDWLDRFEATGPFEVGPLPKERVTGLLLQYRRFKGVLADAIKERYSQAIEQSLDSINKVSFSIRIDPDDPSKAYLRFIHNPLLRAKITNIPEDSE